MISRISFSVQGEIRNDSFQGSVKYCSKDLKFGFTLFIIIELTHSKTILEITVEIEPQPAALDFKNLSQYSSCSK